MEFNPGDLVKMIMVMDMVIQRVIQVIERHINLDDRYALTSVVHIVKNHEHDFLIFYQRPFNEPIGI